MQNIKEKTKPKPTQYWQFNYKEAGELVSALIILEEMLGNSLGQVRRVIKELSKDW